MSGERHEDAMNVPHFVGYPSTTARLFATLLARRQCYIQKAAICILLCKRTNALCVEILRTVSARLLLQPAALQHDIVHADRRDKSSGSSRAR